jgi:rubrerythrin
MAAAAAEYDEQIAEQFRKTLETAARRFAPLARVEERHANHYKDAVDKLNAAA